MALTRWCARRGFAHQAVRLSVACGVAGVALSTHFVAAEAGGGSSAGSRQAQIVSPQPLSGNPVPTYPDQALTAAVDGDVVFIASVSADGHVETVRVVTVPREDVGFEDAVHDAVMQWRFEPARRDGVPIAMAYAGKINFTRRLPYTHARMYSASSQVVWREAQEVIGTLGRALENADAASQVWITRWVRFDAADAGQPPAESAGPGQGIAQEFQLHVFVSPFVEPARVHVGSVSLGPNNVQYNLGVAERWFFQKLETRLGEAGQEIPLDTERHRAVASDLLNERDPCLGTAPTDASASAAPTQLTVVPPIYRGTVERGTQLTVTLQVAISLDGAVVSSRVVEDDGSAVDEEMRSAAAGAVSLWRYTPSASDGCPESFTGFVDVIFSGPDEVTPTLASESQGNDDGGTRVEVYQLGNDVETPWPLERVVPRYTNAARRAMIEGSVQLSVVVLPDGSVGDVQVLLSLDPDLGLDEEAIKAAKQWRFIPGTRFGEPVAVEITIALSFAMR